jgi:hypothetical protein
MINVQVFHNGRMIAEIEAEDLANAMGGASTVLSEYPTAWREVDIRVSTTERGTRVHKGEIVYNKVSKL